MYPVDPIGYNRKFFRHDEMSPSPSSATSPVASLCSVAASSQEAAASLISSSFGRDDIINSVLIAASAVSHSVVDAEGGDRLMEGL